MRRSYHEIEHLQPSFFLNSYNSNAFATLQRKELHDRISLHKTGFHNSYLKTVGEDTTIDIKAVNEKLSQVVPRQQKIREELEAIIKELEGDYHE